MWINLDKDVIEAWAKVAEEHGDKEVVESLRQRITDAFHPDNKKWVEAAKSIHQDEGTVEVDEQSDDSAMISISEDGGAYVLAWVWVYNEDAGFPAKEDEEETADV